MFASICSLTKNDPLCMAFHPYHFVGEVLLHPVLLVVLYGCETWSLTFREEQRLRVFENKVLRKIVGTKREEITGKWRKLHSSELHALYWSPNIIRNLK